MAMVRAEGYNKKIWPTFLISFADDHFVIRTVRLSLRGQPRMREWMNAQLQETVLSGRFHKINKWIQKVN